MVIIWDRGQKQGFTLSRWNDICCAWKDGFWHSQRSLRLGEGHLLSGKCRGITGGRAALPTSSTLLPQHPTWSNRFWLLWTEKGQKSTRFGNLFATYPIRQVTLITEFCKKMDLRFCVNSPVARCGHAQHRTSCFAKPFHNNKTSNWTNGWKHS